MWGCAHGAQCTAAGLCPHQPPWQPRVPAAFWPSFRVREPPAVRPRGEFGAVGSLRPFRAAGGGACGLVLSRALALMKDGVPCSRNQISPFLIPSILGEVEHLRLIYPPLVWIFFGVLCYFSLSEVIFSLHDLRELLIPKPFVCALTFFVAFIKFCLTVLFQTLFLVT